MSKAFRAVSVVKVVMQQEKMEKGADISPKAMLHLLNVVSRCLF